MEIVDGRGIERKNHGEQNRKNIIMWFEKNPGKTIKDCCVSLGLSRPTVSKYVRELKKDGI